MSFELKPQSTVGMLTNANDIVWTQPRSPVPPMLQGRVDPDTWARTFDACQKRIVENLEDAQNLSPIMFIPCFICCTLSKINNYNQENEDAWLRLVQSEEITWYRSVGVQVSLAKEMMQDKTYTVGLRFEVGPMPSVMAEVEAEPVYTPQTMFRPDYNDAKDSSVQK